MRRAVGGGTMPATRVRTFLDRRGVEWRSVRHRPAYTAQEAAAAARLPGREVAKTVILRADGDLVMAVLPAPGRIDLERLRGALRAREVALAAEGEFRPVFRDCEPGAMPPFGNLYGMRVAVAAPLEASERIAFAAGAHDELIRLRYRDWKRLVRPEVLDF